MVKDDSIKAENHCNSPKIAKKCLRNVLAVQVECSKPWLAATQNCLKNVLHTYWLYMLTTGVWRVLVRYLSVTVCIFQSNFSLRKRDRKFELFWLENESVTTWHRRNFLGTFVATITKPPSPAVQIPSSSLYFQQGLVAQLVWARVQ